MNTKNYVSDLPVLGSGLGYRAELRKNIIKVKEEIDFLEIITDQFIENPRRMRELEEICTIFTVIPHGIGLSVGSAMPLDQNYLRAIKHISDLTKSPYYSEHLCMTRAPGIDIGHLSPLWFTEAVLENTIRNVTRVQEYIGKPLVLENVTYLVGIPDGNMSQTEFFNRLVEATGCGVLLDVTNIFINSMNHEFDAIAFLEQMPLNRVVQVHIAGGFWRNEIFIDSHSEPVQEETWKLLQALVSRTQVKGVILEHDSNYPEMPILLYQVAKARQLMRQGTTH